MKINIIGNPLGVGMHSHMAELLWRYGQEAHLNSPTYSYFDATLVLGLWHLRPEILHHNTIVYCCGSDVWANPQLTGLTPLLAEADLVLYGHPGMPKRTEVPGTYWQIPADTDKFWKLNIYDDLSNVQTRDVLFYAPSPGIYSLEKIMDYVETHLNEKCTLIGRGFQDIWMADRPDNLLSIRWVPYNCMRQIYLMHHTFRKWLTHPATPTGKMEIEALLCGLKAILNDKQITEPPKHMLDYYAIPKLLEMIKEVAK